MNENDYQPDFEISKRYIDFSSELLRLSLFGITGIFYLLFVSNDLKKHTKIDFVWFMLAVILFTVSSCFALAHRFYATDALSYHIAFLRKNDPIEKKGLKRCLLRSKIYIVLCQYFFVFALCASFCALLIYK